LLGSGKTFCLIICTKAHHTELAIKDISHRLTKDSTICLVHNVRNLERVIPTQTMAEDCLDVMRSIVGIGENILIDTTPEADHTWAPSTKYLLRLLTLTPPLVAVAETPAGLLQYQLEKLAVNCVWSASGVVGGTLGSPTGLRIVVPTPKCEILNES
jgi:2-dehydropantoate 2-reductase